MNRKQQTLLTPQGYEKLEQELEHMRTTRRQKVARRLHEALTEGDVLENAELEDARNEQAFVEGRILTLVNMLDNAAIIESQGPRETVGLGSRVTVVEGNEPPETYNIVGSVEADPIKGLISNESPLGQALLGRKVGEVANVNAPAGVMAFEIVRIQ